MTIDQTMQQGFQHHQAGRLAEAEQCYRLVLKRFPNHPDALHLMGMLAKRVGKLDLAANLIRRAIAINGTSADYHANLGIVLMEQRQLKEAIAAFQQAIRLRPAFPQAYCNMGSALAASRQWDQAIDAFQSAVRLDPQFAEAHSNLGNALTEPKKFDLAIAASQTAAALRPDSDVIQYNLGHVLKRAGRLDDAIVALTRAIELNPQNLTARCDLGNVLRDQGKRDQAIAFYEQAIAMDPTHAQAHWNLSLTLLLLGDFERGWAEHEWRKKCDMLAKPREFDQPMWKGEPLNGRTILLHPEQGLGDTLQFVRYAPLVAARGGSVIVQCQPELFRLLQKIPGMSQVISTDQPHPQFNLHCPLMSLPLVVGTQLNSIPADVPYLFADTELSQQWKEKLNKLPKHRRVGLTWAGSTTHKNDHNRSIPLKMFEPMLCVDGIQFFCLQKGEASKQISSTNFAGKMIDHTADLQDFADTAALVVNLDLVITVDTSVAHLAGGMGKPVWLLLPHDPDWRWLLDREDSPWYPTMRIFRQQIAGDWESVIARMPDILREELEPQINTDEHR